jgi:hypothetical protein
MTILRMPSVVALRQLSDRLGYDQSYAWVDGTPIGGESDLTNEQRAQRRREEAEAAYRARYASYLGAHGAFGFERYESINRTGRTTQGHRCCWHCVGADYRCGVPHHGVALTQETENGHGSVL